MRVTAVEKQRRGKRVNLYLDGRFTLSLSAEVAAQAGLRAGDELDDEALRSLRETESRSGAMATALRLLSYRPRSESELRQRLDRRGTPPDLVEATLQRLRELNLVDDTAFAQAWVESRHRTSPRGRRLLRQELGAKGVDSDVLRPLLEQIDEADAALRAASRRALSLRTHPYPEFRRRLGDFLRRRGFDYDTVRRTVERLWQELAEEQDTSPSG
ncbi:MAG: RecX family transcriptional regulator [Dehalococcoidia bacterium]